MKRRPPVRPVPSPHPYATVPKLWPGSTIVCLASGPSLTKADVDSVRGRAPVIAVNNTYTYAPWADVLYACDAKWWHEYKPEFSGLKFGLYYPKTDKAVQVLKHTGTSGLETQPDGVRTGQNSGYQAINLAVHLGASRIVLLGYDMRHAKEKSHFFGDHPARLMGPDPARYAHYYPTIVPPLKALGIEVVNCSRDTALTCFPRKPLESVFSESAVQVA